MARYKKRKDGLYSTRTTVGKNPDGSPIIKTIYAKTQAELETKKSVAKLGPVVKHNFKELSEEMLAEKEKLVGVKTYEGYNQALKKLESLYQYDIEDISISMIDNILCDLVSKDFSYSLVSKVKIAYCSTVKYAIRKGVLINDYTRIIQVPKSAKKGERTQITDNDIKVIKNSTNDEFGLYPFMMLCTGMRRGEILALQWKDIDIKGGQIYINKAVEFIGNTPSVKAPKTEKGNRSVPILKTLKPYLSQGKLKTEDEDYYIFGGKKPLTLIMIKKRWKKYIDDHGLNITQHQLRHTYATILYDAGIDAKMAQSLLGHADVQTTLNIYTHISDTTPQKITNKINKAIEKLK